MEVKAHDIAERYSTNPSFDWNRSICAKDWYLQEFENVNYYIDQNATRRLKRVYSLIQGEISNPGMLMCMLCKPTPSLCEGNNYKETKSSISHCCAH